MGDIEQLGSEQTGQMRLGRRQGSSDSDKEERRRRERGGEAAGVAVRLCNRTGHGLGSKDGATVRVREQRCGSGEMAGVLGFFRDWQRKGAEVMMIVINWIGCRLGFVVRERLLEFMAEAVVNWVCFAGD
ncbi:hypothetical protein M0R45_008731 [Rubus argutus]|uniref:Uncharacterized protein n=1 Tax=Rubus argutus TaxID=59490 RepID=A0AAW1Y5W7_RUBAR